MATKKEIYVWEKTGKLTADYDLGKQLGQPGQFGVAKLCTRKKDKKAFAVKIIDKSKFVYAGGSSDQIMSDMKNEIKVMRALKHPNIIKLFEVYEDRFNLYLVQEVCTGGELFDRITALGEKNENYNEKDASLVLKQMLEGVQHMHAKGIVHADLKPDNFLFLTPADDAPLKIIDFGMAKKIPRKRFLRNMCGTPYYTAPEVIKGAYHTSADIWSCGVVMFVMLFGYPPFYVDPDKYGDKENDAIYAKIAKGFVPITKKGYGRHFPAAYKCSDTAKDLMKWMLRKDVAKRYTATQALDHPWFKKASSKDQISQQVLSSITKFTKASKFRLAVVELFKQSVADETQKGALMASFKAMDKDNDGSITVEEFKAHMKKTTKLTDAKIQEMFNSVDVDGDSTLCFDELLTSVYDYQFKSVPERMWKVFKKMDKNNDGSLSKEEITKAMESLKGNQWFDKLGINVEEAIKDADADGDGQISYDEFLNVFMADKKSPAKKKAAEETKEDDEDDDDGGAAGLVGDLVKTMTKDAGKQEKAEKKEDEEPAPAAAAKAAAPEAEG